MRQQKGTRPKEEAAELLTLKPGLWGISIDLKELWRRLLKRRKNQVPTSQTIERDVWLQDAVCFAVHGRWLGEDEEAFPTESHMAKAAEVAQEMRELAGDGRFLVWGKLESGRLHEVISRAFWITNQIDYLRLVADTAPLLRSEPATATSSGLPYLELMASKAQTEQLWPPNRQ
jgi:hypothetical protein